MKSKLIVLAIILAVLAHSASADPLYCTGKIEKFQIGDWYGVYAKPDWHSNFLRICDIDGGWQGVPKDVCKTWLSSIQTAQLLNTSVTFVYKEDTNYTDCSNIPGNSTGIPPDWIIFE